MGNSGTLSRGKAAEPIGFRPLSLKSSFQVTTRFPFELNHSGSLPSPVATMEMCRVQIYAGPKPRPAVHRHSLAQFTNFSYLQLLGMTSVCAHSGNRCPVFFLSRDSPLCCINLVTTPVHPV
jgi:hypothetical protein